MKTIMALDITIQNASEAETIPADADFKNWCQTTFDSIQQDETDELEMTIRIVNEDEGRSLNHEWRQKDYATNVLSFPFQLEDEKINVPLLGDIVICATVVQAEAAKQNKTLESHWAHLTIHGTLHLLGLDHVETADAEEMEALERSILAKLGYPDPYQDETSSVNN